MYILYNIFNYYLLRFNKKPFWNKVIIIIFIIIFFLIYMLKTTSACYAQEPTHVDLLLNGMIPRTPLLQPGQTIYTLPHGAYNVTGGVVYKGNLGDGRVTKVIGIAAQGNTVFTYIPGTQPYNSNFSSILFELREAGQPNVSHSCLDYISSR